MLKIICGNAGSGKSSALEKLIIEDVSASNRAYLIVPEQESMRCERRMADILPPSAALCFEVVNFSRLANIVFRHYGALSYNYADEPIKALVMWRTLSMLEPQLKQFNGIYENGGVKKILSAIKTFRASGISMEQLALAAEKLDGESRFAQKLVDLSLVGSVYKGLLEEKYDDSANDLDRLCDILSKEKFFDNCNVYVDSFTSFTGQELSVLKRIISQADNVSVALLCDEVGGTLPHYKEVYQTAARLIEIADRVGCEYSQLTLGESRRSSHASLRFAAEKLWSMPISKFDDDDGAIRLIESDDVFDEAEKISADILNRVRNGAKFSDMAVIFRNALQSRGIIDTAFERAGIPYFISESSDSEAKPLIKLIENAIQIIVYGWRRKDVVSYVKTGLLGFDEEAIDLFELYAAAWNINGIADYALEWTASPDGYKENIGTWKKYQLETANSVREAIIKPLNYLATALSGNFTVDQATDALINYLGMIGIEAEIEKTSERLLEQKCFSEASELVRLWNLIIDAFRNIKFAIGDMQVTREKYLQMIKLLFSELSIGKLPEYLDTVIIGSANSLRVGDVRYVYLAGVNDAEFPGTAGKVGMFSDTELKQLEEIGLTFDNTSDVAAASELLYFYRAFCVASENVTISYPVASPSGELKQPSIAVSRLKKMFPYLAENTVGISEIDLLNTDASLLLHYADAYDDKISSAIKIAAEKRGITLPNREDRELKNMNVKVSRQIAESVFAGNASFSQSKLEKYEKCPLSYYCKYILRLDDNTKVEFGNDIRGTFIHHVLEEFLKRIVFDKTPFSEIDNSQICRMTDEIISVYLRNICHGEPSVKISNIAERLKKIIRIILRNICAEFAQSDFSPACFELNIRDGGDVDALPISLPDGSNVRVEGFVDRLDVCHIGDKTYVRVVDYKSSNHTIKLDDIAKGENLQMLIYLFAVCRGATEKLKKQLGANGDLLPAGVLYFGNLGKETESKNIVGSSDDAELLAEQNLMKEGLLLDDEEVLRAMEKDLEGKYIPISICNRKKNSAKILFSFEVLRDLYTKVENVICESVERIKSGDACAKRSGYHGHCDFCNFEEICRKG